MIDFSRKRNQSHPVRRGVGERHLLIPICSCCHRIQDEQKSWQKQEAHLCEASVAEFSHGLCPACYEDQRAAFRKVKPRRPLRTAVGGESRI